MIDINVAFFKVNIHPTVSPTLIPVLFFVREYRFAVVIPCDCFSSFRTLSAGLPVLTSNHCPAGARVDGFLIDEAQAFKVSFNADQAIEA